MVRRTGSGLLLGLGAAAAVLALTACAQQVDSAGGDGSGTPATSPATSPGASTGTGDDASPSPSASSSGGELVEASDLPLEAGAVGRGLPDGVPGAMDSPAGAAWSPAEGLLYVVTYGSSSCPSLAEARATGDATAVTVTLLPPKDGMCTMDWAPTTTVVEVPDGADSGSPVSVALGTHGTVELPARTSAGEPGEVAWVGLS